MSPLNSLNRRRSKKKEDLGTTGWMLRQDQASLVIMSLYYCTHSCKGGRVNLFTHKATAIVKLYCYS